MLLQAILVMVVVALLEIIIKAVVVELELSVVIHWLLLYELNSQACRRSYNRSSRCTCRRSNTSRICSRAVSRNDRLQSTKKITRLALICLRRFNLGKAWPSRSSSKFHWASTTNRSAKCKMSATSPLLYHLRKFFASRPLSNMSRCAIKPWKSAKPNAARKVFSTSTLLMSALQQPLWQNGIMRVIKLMNQTMEPRIKMIST